MSHPRKALTIWAAVVLMGLWLSSCSSHPPSTPIKPAQQAGTSDRATPEPAPTPGPTPKPAEYYAFAFRSLDTTIIARYRDHFKTVEYFWQAGLDVGSVSEPYRYVFLYDLDDSIFLYDANFEERIKLVDGREVGGFAFSPSLSRDDVLWFLGTSDPDLAAQGIGFAYVKYPPPKPPEVDAAPPAAPSPAASPTPTPAPTPSPAPTPPLPPTPAPYEFHWPRDGAGTGVAYAVAPINAFAVLHGGITSLRIASYGTFAVFSTADGGLYLYSIFDKKVLSLLPNQLLEQRHFADAPRVDPFYNRLLVWQDLRHNTVYLMDLWTGAVDTVPTLNRFTRGVVEPDPKFIDAFHVAFTYQVSPDDVVSRIAVYNVLSQSILALVTPDVFPIRRKHP